jgi:hypothetical protein
MGGLIGQRGLYLASLLFFDHHISWVDCPTEEDAPLIYLKLDIISWISQATLKPSFGLPILKL